MLRSLVDEVIRRRLWPIPLVALLVAIAAPLLFMKSAPTSTPAVPEAAAPGTLPKKADILLKSTDRPVVPKRSTRKAQDPFAPPPGSIKDASASASAAGAGAAKTSSSQSVPIVIKNSDGTTSTATISQAGSSTKSTKTTTTKTTKTNATTKTKTPKITTPTVTVPKTSSSSAVATSRVTYVDVRFGERMGTMKRYRVPRLQTFRAGGKVAAMFVKYSPKRNAAVFAIAPSTAVSGVTCRKVKDVCRYVDIPEGAHARLKLVGTNGSLVSRRIDVVGIRHLPKVAGSTASARKTTLPTAKCLLKSLLSLSVFAPSISTDSCE